MFSHVVKKLIREEIRRQVNEAWDINHLRKIGELYNGAMVREDESLYGKFMAATLKAFAEQKGLQNIESPQELPPELKKEFYTYIDEEWKAYKERTGGGEEEGDQPPMDANAPGESGEMPVLTPPAQVPAPTKMEAVSQNEK